MEISESDARASRFFDGAAPAEAAAPSTDADSRQSL